VSGSDPNLEMIKLLAENGARINSHSNKKQTPLHIAAMFGHLSVVKYLGNKNKFFF
jgi:ankyrin repeat protein